MERSKTQLLGAFFQDLLSEEPDLHEGLLEQQAINYFRATFKDYMSDIVSMHLTQGTLYVRTFSNALMQTILLSRADLIREVNAQVQAEIVQEIKVSLSGR